MLNSKLQVEIGTCLILGIDCRLEELSTNGSSPYWQYRYSILPFGLEFYTKCVQSCLWASGIPESVSIPLSRWLAAVWIGQVMSQTELRHRITLLGLISRASFLMLSQQAFPCHCHHRIVQLGIVFCIYVCQLKSVPRLCIAWWLLWRVNHKDLTYCSPCE